MLDASAITNEEDKKKTISGRLESLNTGRKNVN